MANPKILFINEEIALRRAMKVNAAKNLSGGRVESPLPAQVEGLATPRPWHVDGYQIYGADGQFVGSTFNKTDDALIVRAVNSFDALVEALRLAQPLVHGYLQAMGGTHADEILNQIDEALKLAEGKQS